MPHLKQKQILTASVFLTALVGLVTKLDLAKKALGELRGDSCAERIDGSPLGYPDGLCVTHKVFLDISIAGKEIGRLDIGLFGEVVPLSAQNFVSFAQCMYGPTRCLKGDRFHRVVPNFVIQGGSSSTANSFINNATFREERSPDHHSFIAHGRRGVLAWAEYPIGSQFYITLCCKDNGPRYLDGNHVVFGSLLGDASSQTLSKMASVQLKGESPQNDIVITDAGLYGLAK
eukprot:Plantae.Rhodophyta-Purpureofilum_apyrenoidigerum.ctg7852.p1 GENE.Plantae.Rhodophyta-Purpureofilum_apyrenoidigerum.ctg7852~~Plantae.Rhodophyta-Purpureofilum_apyrenoidigerum.ctg7852.p1  ORF type:complete len:231 (+),score=28.64 Plantae.Rhodophyta-Purpureofilum_apyrenoidigerum.ctg7852:256-948(+)